MMPKSAQTATQEGLILPRHIQTLASATLPRRPPFSARRRYTWLSPSNAGCVTSGLTRFGAWESDTRMQSEARKRGESPINLLPIAYPALLGRVLCAVTLRMAVTRFHHLVGYLRWGLGQVGSIVGKQRAGDCQLLGVEF